MRIRQLAECEDSGTRVFCVLGGTVTLNVGSGTDPVVEPEPHCSFAVQPEWDFDRLAGVHFHRLRITANIRTVKQNAPLAVVVPLHEERRWSALNRVSLWRPLTNPDTHGYRLRGLVFQLCGNLLLRLIVPLGNDDSHLTRQAASQKQRREHPLCRSAEHG